jgi:hypothetical protein
VFSQNRVTYEREFAGRHGHDYLDASQLVGEYQTALDIALGGPTRLETLYVDLFHPCVPLVPATYVKMLPYIALARS